jgi:hypothetical protein
MGAVAVLLVVGLLATIFLTLARTHSVSPGGSAAQTPASPTACAATAITAHLGAQVYLTDLAMTSPTAGWAVGETGGGAPRGVIFHYEQCQWTALPQRYTGVGLNSVSMVSATEGWAVGGTPSRSDQPFALHYTGGAWRQVAIPLPSGSGAFIKVRMINAHEGWILASPSKLLTFNNVLLHFRNGVWTPVALPFDTITDIAPVGTDDLWIASGNTETPTKSALAHYQAGQWTSFSAPEGVTLSHLRANAPTDIYAMGSVQAASGVPSAATPADLHYDGSSWTRLPLTGRGVGQTVELLSATDGWAFQWEHGSDAASSDHIARADHLSGGATQPATLPTNDLNFISAITPMPDGSYWAIGGYEVTAPSDNAGSSASLFLRYADGAWSQYGHV